MAKYKLDLKRPDGTIKTVPWDKEEDPTPDEIHTLLQIPDEKTGLLKRGWDYINEPTTNLPSRVGGAGANALYDYGEHNNTPLGKAAMIGGAFTDSLGKVGDTLTSPVNLALTAITGGAGLARGAVARAVPDVAMAEKALFAARMAGNEGEATRLVSELASARRFAGTADATRGALNSVGRVAGGTQAANAAVEGVKNRDPKQIVPMILGLAGMRGHTSPLNDVPAINTPANAGRMHGPMPEIDMGPMEKTPFEGLTPGPETPQFNWDAEHQAGLPLEWNDAQHQDMLSQEPRSAGMVRDRPEIHGFEALVPNRYKSGEPSYPQITGPKQPELFPNPSPETPIIMQPKQFDFERPTWSRYAEQRQLPLEYDTLSQAEVSDVPEIQKAVKQVVEDQHSKAFVDQTKFTRAEGYKNPDKTQNWAGRIKDDLIKSNYKVLTQDSPAGRGIASMIDKYRAETGRTSGEISTQIKDVVNPLTKDQFAQFQQLLDSGADLVQEKPNITVENPNVGIKPKVSNDAPGNGITNAEMRANLKEPTIDEPNLNLGHEFSGMTQPTAANYQTKVDPMVKLALNTVRDLDQKFTQRVVASGIHLKLADGTLVPFVGKDNYWPRMYDHSMFADKPALVARLIKQGMAPELAAKAVGNARKFGERLIDPQNQRVMDLPDHRKDLGALLKHYDDMSHRVVAAETMGVKDIADPSTPISQLVAQTKDPTRISQILTQYLGRDGGIAPYEADMARKISKATTLFYLSKFAISNTNQISMIPVVADMASTTKAVGEFLKSPKNAWKQAEGMGALQTVLQESMREVGGESMISKMYGIKASEGANRTIAAIAGKHYVLDLFNKVQKNPNNQAALKSLSDLTLTSPEDLMKQTTLSDKQIAYGATRVAEKSQGRAQSIDLPYNWDRSPYFNLLTLYKKFAFVQGRLLKDALKIDSNKPFVSKEGLNVNPKNAALLATLFQLSGEATGDAKASIKGLFTGDPGQKIQDRGKDLGLGMMNRVVQNYIDSMFLGLLGDAIQASGRSKGLLEFGAGPVVGGAADLFDRTHSDMMNLKDKNPASAASIRKNPNKSQVLRDAASKIPYIGSGVRELMK